MSPPFLASPLLNGVAGIRHGFFTRRGGVSTGVYDSLNVGRGSEDSPENIVENRRRLAAALGAASLNVPYQIHSNRVATIDRDLGSARPEADGVATAAPGVLCGALAADCAPILLVDPRAGIVCAAHAGWKGALAGVAEGAVRALEALGGRADRMIAVVGPCIGPASYEVGPEFRERFATVDPANARFFEVGAPGKFLFDLPRFVIGRLEAVGVGASEWIGADTAADPDFFSYRQAFRRGDPDYGRMASAIIIVG